MPPHDPRLTLRLDGPRITADHFARAINAFFDLLDDVSEEMTGSSRAVEWIVSVDSGSDVVHARPEIAQERRIQPVTLVRAVSRGVGLVERRSQRPQHFTDSALRTTRDLASVADGQNVRVAQILAPAESNVTISNRVVKHINQLLGEDVEEYGTIEGRLQTLSERRRPHFAVYDPLTDQPIRCYVKADQLDRAWRAFGRRVAVTGLIRYRRNGQPVSVEADTMYVFPPDDDLPTAEDVYGILDTVQ